MSSNIQQAFEDWYRGQSDSWWCEYDATNHSHESDCSLNDAVDNFASGLSATLVSDDAVDMDIWRATHSVD